MDGISGILGVDCGAVAVGMAVVSPDLAIVGTAYRFHRGDIKRTVLEMLNGDRPLHDFPRGGDGIGAWIRDGPAAL